jgi:NodT family efflux transporter outer membrane factor (OMF) lipoprotein
VIRPALTFVPAIAMLASLAACDLGPDYRRPATELPLAWRASATTAAQAWPAPDWWRGFRSPELDALIAEAQRNNPDIAAAIARVRQADAEVRIAGAPLLPTVTASATGNYQRTGSGGSRFVTTSGQTLYTSAGSASRYRDFRQYTASGDVAYEADFWGRNAAALESARASAVFSRWDQQVVALTVVTSVANTWFTALDLQDRLAIAERNLADAEQTLQVIRARLQVGTASLLDLSQQEALVAGQRAVIPSLRNQLEQEVIGVGILIGRPPEALAVRPGTLKDLALPAVYPGLPSELLARRPDVAEAEAQLVAANANIKAARAAFFPAIQLTGSAGYQSLALATLFGPGASVLSLAANATQPIFDAGTLRGQLEQARGRYDELVADYRKAILQAFTDVETALTALRFTADQLALQEQAVATARRAADIAGAQLAAGTVDITTVLTAELTLFGDEDTLAQVRLAHYQALLNLYKALGGGWSQPAGPIPDQFPGLSPGRIGGGFALPVGDNIQ